MKTGKQSTGKKRTVKKAAAPEPKANGNKADAKAVQKKATIKQLVVRLITANPGIANAEMIATVRKHFPESAFKDTHAAWYRSQARQGRLTGTPIEIPQAGRRKE